MVTPNFPSLGDRLRHRLQQVVPFAIPVAEIPVKLGRDRDRLRYRSAVALKFAKVYSSPADSLALANDIANHWKTPEFEVSVTPPGFLDVTVADAALAEWLQHLACDRGWENDDLQYDRDNYTSDPSTSVEVPFSVQYACYRCGSLLRLGEREGFVRLDSPKGDRIVEPFPLPWLDLASNFQLRCIRHSERDLISECAFVADALVAEEISDRPRQILKLATRLAEAFETFHRDCRIVGRPRAIAQVRLGLLAVTRVLLKWLLEAGLGVSALTEL
ncbi:cyanobacterial hypothetical protein [Geitlerinema sp. FC II]|nr:DALR anticodon-binding domain-containing protein [Geitlerinema sp. CS-897]PPT06947.1 cyanobacterial hypothetical protein [Geitlerinema sp. FC II]